MRQNVARPPADLALLVDEELLSLPPKDGIHTRVMVALAFKRPLYAA